MILPIFSLATNLSRTAALGALEKRAHENGLLIVTCAWCKAFIGEEPSETPGMSHSCCETCIAVEMEKATFRGDVQ